MPRSCATCSTAVPAAERRSPPAPAVARCESAEGGHVTQAIDTAAARRSRPHWFRDVATAAADVIGDARTFLAAAAVILGWLATGPLFGFSDAWQLLMDSATSVITFLIVILVQNTQNRDVKAIQLKLDELIRAVDGARNRLVNLEQLSDADLDVLQAEFTRLRTAHTPAAPPAGQAG